VMRTACAPSSNPLEGDSPTRGHLATLSE
jgi:hypothetical protein